MALLVAPLHFCPLRNLYAAAPDLYAGFTRADQVAWMDTAVAQRGASEPRHSAIATTFVRGVLARVAARRLYARLAAGEDPLSDVALACHSRQLVSGRSRQRLACGVDRACAMPPGHAVLSAAVAVDEHAGEVARPALQQLASTVRSSVDIEPRGVAITQVLLTEPAGALYRPAYREELYELARAALFALGSREAASAGRRRR